MAEAGRRAPPPLGLCDPATRRVRRPETEDGPAAGQGTVRLQLDLSEPDELSSPEFNYGELIQSLQARKDPSGAAPARDPSDPFNDDERERQEMEALAKKFENRYGAPCRKKRRDRVQDLIDIGFGYDESDPFIDNSEAYDELVPASLSTKLGGFYINTGTLQFRVASESEGDEAEGDEGVIKEEEESGLKRKKGKEEDEEEKKVKRVQLPEPGLAPLNVHRPEKKKRKKLMKDSLCLAAMLHRFTKEKAKEEMRRKNVVGVHPSPITWPHHPQNLHSNAQNSDPLLTDLTSDPAVMSLLTSSNESELQDLLSDLDFSVLDAGPQPAAVGRENGQLAVGVGQKMAGVALARGVGLLSPPPLPEGLPQPLVKRIEDLRAASRQFDQEGRKKFFTLDMNNILLDIELQVQEQPPAVRSGVYSHLEAFVPCNKDTLLKRLKKLSLNIQDDRLRTPLLKLKLAVCSVMPEQTARYNMDCLARVAKQQMEDGERNGSEEDEEERPGKRVIGPRKKFIWDDKLRTLLCNLVRVKLKCYEQEKSSLSVEDYLKAFMENEVKPLWPKGWMQARMLFKESRTVHGHLTDLGKKRIVQPPKPAKVKEWEWNQQPIQALGPSAFPAVPGPVRPPLSPTSEPICLSDSLDDDLATNSLDSIAQALSLLSNAANGVTVNSATTAASCSPPAVSTHLSSLVSHAETLPTTSLASSTHPSTPQPSSARVELFSGLKDAGSLQRNTMVPASIANSIVNRPSNITSASTTQPAKPRPPPTASPLLPPQQKLFGVKPSQTTPPTGQPKNLANKQADGRSGGSTGLPQQTSVNSHAPLQNSKIPQQVARVPSSPCQSPTPHSPQGKVQTQTSPLVHHQPGFITPMQATITKSSHSSSSSPIIKLSHRPPAPTPPSTSSPSPNSSPRPQIMTPPLQYSPKSPGFRPPFNINPAGKPAAQQVSYSFAGAQKSTSPLGGTSASITNPSPKATLQPAGFQDSNPSPSAVSANHGQRQRPVGGASQSAKSSASRMPTLGLTSPSDAALLSQVSSSAGGNLLSSVGAPLPLSFGMLGGLVPVSLPFQFPSLLNFTPPGPASTGGASPTPNSGYSLTQNLFKSLQSGVQAALPPHLQLAFSDTNQSQAGDVKRKSH
ncbi:ubinuclein-2a isoform X2 [Pygocentrus nattereri]|uniref:ubinuclein-2a isoform X2 n=1 Tax=Pygocentrus nattereri TaxID=42514 RepID=UPI0008147DA0|nr:ubinuclein-2a isoform X2 [Pygocentrus nattereri]